MDTPTKDVEQAPAETRIHPTAVVHKKAELDVGVEVGPLCVIEAGAKIGRGTWLGAHAVIHGRVSMGARNRVYSGAVIGGDPQTREFKVGENSRLEIGDDNIMREQVTLHCGLEDFGGVTKIGNHNHFLAGSHAAHDCHIGNDCVFSNFSGLAGHVVVHDHVTLSGLVVVHQFCAIGEHAFVGGASKVVQDIPPYVIADGHRARLYGINKIGLERKGILLEEIRNLQAAYKLFFRSKTTSEKSLAIIEKKLGDSPCVQKFMAFIRNSTRGIPR